MNSNPDALIAELDALLGIGGPAKPANSEPPPGVAFFQVPPPPPVQAPAPAPEPAAAPARQAPAVALPIQNKVPEPARIFDPAPPAPVVRSPRILVVDDNDDYREAVKFVLQDRGYEVVEAVDGANGVRQALKAPGTCPGRLQHAQPQRVRTHPATARQRRNPERPHHHVHRRLQPAPPAGDGHGHFRFPGETRLKQSASQFHSRGLGPQPPAAAVLATDPERGLPPAGPDGLTRAVPRPAPTRHGLSLALSAVPGGIRSHAVPR